MEINPVTYEEAAHTRSGMLKLADLPSGTVLFKAVHLKPEHEGKDIFSDLLGRISGSSFCLSPTQNTYTFPFPYIGFGLYDWTSELPSWQKYNAFIVYILTETRPFVSMINPSPDVRGTPKGNEHRDAEITRCDKFGTHCPGDSKEYLKWDNCINRNYMNSRGTIGHISIAELDSIDIEKSAKGGKKTSDFIPPNETHLGKYLKTLSATNPEAATIALTQFYTCSPTDKTGKRLRTHRGIPEITLYSNKLLTSHPLVRPVHSIEDASHYYSQDMAANAFTLVPVAIITANNIYDTVLSSSFNSVNASAPSANARKTAIEHNLQRFMSVAQTSGIGPLGKMAYDRRTGFYVMENMTPSHPIADWYTNSGEPVTYRGHLIDRLDTLSSKSDAILSAISQKKPQPSGEFMFERPSSIRAMAAELEIEPVQISNTIITPELLFSFDAVEGGKQKTNRRKTRKRGGRLVAAEPLSLVLPISSPRSNKTLRQTPIKNGRLPPTAEHFYNSRTSELSSEVPILNIQRSKNSKKYTLNQFPMPVILATAPAPISLPHEEAIKKAANSISKITTSYITKLISTI